MNKNMAMTVTLKNLFRLESVYQIMSPQNLFLVLLIMIMVNLKAYEANPAPPCLHPYACGKDAQVSKLQVM